MRERTKKTTARDDAQDNPQEPQSADTPPPPEREPEKAAEAHTSEPLPEPGSDGDIFKHPELLRLNMSYLQKPVAKKLLTTVPIRKPNKQDFIRVHPDENYRFLASLIELRDEREIYFLDPRFAPELEPSEFYFATLHLCVNRQRVWFVWPVKLPSSDGRANSWQQSAVDAADHAIKNWVRVIPNMNLGAYDIHMALAEFPPPEWPEMPFMNVLEIAFKGRVIGSHDHPVIKRLRGLQ